MNQDNNYNWPANGESFWPSVQRIFNNGFDANKEAFKSWYPVQRIPIYSPHFGIVETAYIGEVLSYLKKISSDKALTDRWLKALEESKVGHTDETYELFTTPLTVNEIKASAWTVKTAAHLIKFLESTPELNNTLNQYDHIIELGAGIGEMARMIHKLELFNGKYTIVDFPAIAQVSKYYTEKNGIDVEFITDINNVSLSYPPNRTLVIGTWSINEMPFEPRTQFLLKLAKCHFMMSYSLNILGLQNSHYYASEFVKITKSPITHLEFIPYHPFDGGNYYMFCTST